VYSLGILLFELICGRTPWSGTVAEVLHNHAETRAPTLGELRVEEVDPALETLVARALAKKPAERHADMKAFLYELRNVMSMLGYLGHRQRRIVSATGRQEPVAGDEASEATEDDANETADDDTAPSIDKRLTLIESTYDSLRLALATLDQEGRIIAANAAFAKFLVGLRVDIEGTRIHDTNLARVWTTLDEDLELACAGESVGRKVEIIVDDGSCVPLRMWLEPISVFGFAALSLYPQS
jgi:PAS domain-containing protein